MRNIKDFQERYNKWKKGERYWDIRGVDLPRYDEADKNTNQTSQIYQNEDGSYYAAPTPSSYTEDVTPLIQRNLSDPSTWDFVGSNSGKHYTTQYTDDQLRMIAQNSMPNAEMIPWVDRAGNKHRSMRIMGMSGADPIGSTVVDLIATTPLFKPIGAIGNVFAKDFARDFAFTRLGNWARNKILSNQLNEQSGKFVGNTISHVDPLIQSTDHSIGNMEYAKPWKSSYYGNKTRINSATKYYYKDDPNYFFELVKDKEPGYMSVHFKTDRQRMSFGDKMRLFAKVADEVPEGYKLSTYGSLTKGGIHGVNRFGKDFGFIKVGERDVTDKAGNHIKIPILQKPLNLLSRLVKSADIREPNVFRNKYSFVRPVSGVPKRSDVGKIVKDEEDYLKWFNGDITNADQVLIPIPGTKFDNYNNYIYNMIGISPRYPDIITYGISDELGKYPGVYSPSQDIAGINADLIYRNMTTPVHEIISHATDRYAMNKLISDYIPDIRANSPLNESVGSFYKKLIDYIDPTQKFFKHKDSYNPKEMRATLNEIRFGLKKPIDDLTTKDILQELYSVNGYGYDYVNGLLKMDKNRISLFNDLFKMGLKYLPITTPFINTSNEKH